MFIDVSETFTGRRFDALQVLSDVQSVEHLDDILGHMCPVCLVLTLSGFIVVVCLLLNLFAFIN